MLENALNTQAVCFLSGLTLVLIGVGVAHRLRFYPKVALLLSGATLIRLSVALDPFLHEWDERFHALVAKNMTSSWLKPALYPDAPLAYTIDNWTSNHVWLHKQPGALWVMSAFIRLFGAVEWAARMPSLLFSVATVGLTIMIARRLLGEKTALWAGLFMAVNGFIVESAGGRVATEHVDTAFTFFVVAGVAAVVVRMQNPEQFRGWAAAGIGVLTGLAVLCKWLPGGMILLLYVAAIRMYRLHWGECFLAAAVAALVALPWQFYASARYPIEYAFEMQFNSRHFSEVIEGHDHPVWYYLDRARIQWNELIYIPLVWLAYQIFSPAHRHKTWIFLGLWIAAPYVVFSLARTKMPGYVLMTTPAIFMVSAHFMLQKGAGLWSKIRPWFMAVFVLLALRYAFERVKPFADRSLMIERKTSVTRLVAFADSVTTNGKTAILQA